MAYHVEQINNLEQFGEFFTTFILKDDAGIMPDVRLEKNFVVNDSLEKRILNQKKIDALFYENEYLNSIE